MNDLPGPVADKPGEEQSYAAAGQALFQSAIESWIEPEVARRLEVGEWSEGDRLHRFQVQFLDNDEVVVRLNSEVQGYLEVKAAGPIEKGQVIYEDDFSEIADYRLPEEHAHHPHITGFAHHGNWFLSFQLGGRDPGRHEALASGREFLGAAHDAHAAGRLCVCFDTAFSAVELFARAELLSSAPAIEFAQKSKTHKGLSNAYNAWSAQLENSDRRFAGALNRLTELRRQARYRRSDLEGDAQEAAELLAVLDEMEKHVAHLAEAPMHELPDRFTVIALRALTGGELVDPAATTIFPPKG